jgi:hypothetical protein
MRRNTEFQTIRSEGGLLPPDLLRRVLDPSGDIEGTRPQDYGLPESERFNEVITQTWNRLRKHWSEFHDAMEKLPEGEAGTGLTNERWSLPLLRELGYGVLSTSPAPEIGGRTYAINRFHGPVPLHLIGCGLSLDRRTAGARGAASANPHGLVQEFLNRSEPHLWAIVTNGRILRVLRDNQALSRQSYLEFDLEGMLTGEVYSDFVLLWMMVHATRFVPSDTDRPETCWLEKWTKVAEEQGTRALGDLRGGVEKALQILGEGFTSHPKNTDLRDALRSGELTLADFHGQLLRVVYRLIFLFVAEDRTIDGISLLHPRDDSDEARLARERYSAHYSTARLRELAGQIKGSRHGDLWRQFQVLVGALAGDEETSAIRDHLGLPALGSFLWNPRTTAALNAAEIANFDFLESLRRLAYIRQGKVLRPVDYRSLGAEELGGVYESLLELTPQISSDGARFTFAEYSGNERKLSGSYYTPDSLVQCLLDSALDPVVEEAISGKSGDEAEHAILNLNICDPAVGSGHFLVGAAHRLARHLSRVRALSTGDGEPSPLQYQSALRDVIGRCLYGVDINPMSAELCRVGLWLEALEPGKPLSFLDHHIRVGNSLLGTTPGLIADGLPDGAFKAASGDDKKACTALKKLNASARTGWGGLFRSQDEEAFARLQRAAALVEDLPDSSPQEVGTKERAFRDHLKSPEYRQKRRLADTWCAAFMVHKRLKENGAKPKPLGITQAHITSLSDGQGVPNEIGAEIDFLTESFGFFHWYLAFPEVFANGGFDCVLGNPPWERIKLQEEEFFAWRSPDIAKAKNAAARKRLIARLPDENPNLAQEWNDAVRAAEVTSNFLRLSGRFPLGGVGDVNTYAVFADLSRQLISPTGRVGMLLPNGLVTGYTYRAFLRDLIESRTLASFFGFENEDKIFPNVHNETKFGAITITGPERPIERPWFTAHLRQPDQINDDTRRYALTAEQIKAINPNTLNLPAFRWAADAEVTAQIHAAAPVLRRIHGDGSIDCPWNVRFKTLFHMANDSGLFIDNAVVEPLIVRREGALAILSDGRRLYPLYEGKMLWHFDHRYGTYANQTVKQANKGVLPHVDAETHDDPLYRIQSRYWVDAEKTNEALGKDRDREWCFAWRDVGPKERTFIGCLLPKSASGDKSPLMFSDTDPAHFVGLVALLSSLVVDFDARQTSQLMKYYLVEQLAALTPDNLRADVRWLGTSANDWLGKRVLELSYTSVELKMFASDLGFHGPPFRWNSERRSFLQAEIDAAVMHLYGLNHDQAEWILDSFTVIKKYEERYLGEFQTKTLVLSTFDAMKNAIDSGGVYQTPLAPQPADANCCHPNEA